MDARGGAAEPSGLPDPDELLSAAFAACLSMSLERSSAIRTFQQQPADIDVTARRQDQPPTFAQIEYQPHAVSDENERRVNLLHRHLRQVGSVCNALSAVCHVHSTVIPIPDPDDDSP